LDQGFDDIGLWKRDDAFALEIGDGRRGIGAGLDQLGEDLG